MSQSNPSCIPSPRGDGETASVHVRAPCRLHLGMFSFGGAAGRQFGGVGAMVEPPVVEVAIRPAEQFTATGALAPRTAQFVQSIVQSWRLGSLPACAIDVNSPPDHTGLGVGTQLGLAIAAGLRRFLHLPDLAVEELAVSVERGQRSAVGTHGFQQGGLIVDAGKEAGEMLGTLCERVPVPAAWRFVLIQAAADRGLAGATEAEAFARLPPVDPRVTEKLWRIATDQMLPALRPGDCAAFGEAVYQFGRLAGSCFSPVQGGPFASRRIADLIEALRAHGVAGIGQSSWGPTVFAILPGEAESKSLAAWLREQADVAASDIVIARPNNTGAQVSTV